MTVIRGFMITFISSLAFGSVGAILGYFLGSNAPDYYRTVFAIPSGEQIDAARLGLGLGLTQGLGAGLVAGLVIVVATAWYNSRTVPDSHPSG